MILSLIACNKTEIQQTRDTIRSADSLIKTANDGFKTLDSISKIVNDSAKFNKVIIPQIEKHKESVEKVIKENAKSLDSVSAIINKAKNEIEKNQDLVKTVDSASRTIQNSDNPIEALSTISKTLEKISIRAKSTSENKVDNTSNQNSNNSQNNTSKVQQQPTVFEEPVYKNRSLEIEVNDLVIAKQNISSRIKNAGGRIVSENNGEQAGQKKSHIKAKIPMQNFDEISNYASSIGSMKSDQLEINGTDFQPKKMGDFEIILTEQLLITGNENIAENNGNPENETYGEKSSNAFMKGFDVVKDAFLVILPFWPFLLIVGIVLFFLNRRNKKKNLQNDNHYRQQEPSIPQEKIIEKPTEVSKDVEENNDDEDPYAKYRPK